MTTEGKRRLFGAGWPRVLCVALALCGPLALARPGSAQSMADKLQFCDSAADVALAATAARDNGVPIEDVRKLVTDTVPEGDKRVLLSAVVQLTYAMEGVEAPLVQEVTLQMCHAKTGLK